MWRFILIRLAAVCLALSISVAPTLAQNRPADRMTYDTQTNEPIERGPPVPQYALAFVSILLVMLILCMPSRKRAAQ